MTSTMLKCTAKLAMLLTPSAGFAQDTIVTTPGHGDSIAYPAAFYSGFNPQSALDMLARTPGFTLDSGGEARGFGVNAANVVIDGQRPTVKTGGVAAVLGQIAAARVARIELIRGADLPEAQGRTLVANVVLRTDLKASGNAALEWARAAADRVRPARIDVSYTRKLGSWEVTGGVVATSEHEPISGGYAVFDAGGALISKSRETLSDRTSGLTVSGAAHHVTRADTYNLTFRVNLAREIYTQIVTPILGTAAASRTDGLIRTRDGELGGDWSHTFGKDWALKLVGLGRTGTGLSSEVSPAMLGGDAFAQRSRTIEAVGRATLSRTGDHRWLPEIGGEVAYNRLTSRLNFVADGVPQSLPGSLARVSEIRYDGFANLTVQIASKLRLEAATKLEISDITAGRSRMLIDIAPALAISWQAGPKTELRLGIKREVGQLDFSAFAASGDLINDRPIAGNAALAPETTTTWSGSVDHRFGVGGALSLVLSRAVIAEALAYVPLASGGEALANFGSVSEWLVSAEGTLPLTAIVEGAQITATASLTRAMRLDPVTLDRRPDKRDGSALDVRFRHDLARLRSAYGVSFTAASAERQWYVAEVSRQHSRPGITSYVETTAIKGLKTTLTLSSVTGEREQLTRHLFSPNRSGALVSTERRTRMRGSSISLLFARQL